MASPARLGTWMTSPARRAHVHDSLPQSVDTISMVAPIVSFLSVLVVTITFSPLEALNGFLRDHNHGNTSWALHLFGERNSSLVASKDDGLERTIKCRALDKSHECDLGYFTCMIESMDYTLKSRRQALSPSRRSSIGPIGRTLSVQTDQSAQGNPH